MKFKLLILIVLFFLLTFCNKAIAQNESEVIPETEYTNIALEVTLKPTPICNICHRSHKYFLAIELTNLSDKTLHINPSFLPWGNSTFDNLQISAIKTIDGNKLNPPALPFSCLGASETVINPGESLKGDINLSGMFLDLPDAIKITDVTFNWSYQLKSDSSYLPSNKVSGSCVITKQPLDCPMNSQLQTNDKLASYSFITTDDIEVNVFYAKDGQLCKIVITPNQPLPIDEAQTKIYHEIIDKLIPSEQLGLFNHMGYSGTAPILLRDTVFDHARITDTFTKVPGVEEARISQSIIYLRTAACECYGIED